MAASVRDLVSVAVKAFAVLMLATGLVVGQHAETVFHGEDLIVDTTVISILVAEIVEALPQLSNKLVLL